MAFKRHLLYTYLVLSLRRRAAGKNSATLEFHALIKFLGVESLYTEAKVDVIQEIEQSNGLHQLGQPVAPSVLFPVLHPL